MNAVILDAGSTVSCRPLTCTRPLAACPVANKPLIEAQKSFLHSSGIRTAGKISGIGLYMKGAAWLSRKMISRLLTAVGSAVVCNDSGESLAWVGDSVNVDRKARKIQADENSFLIRYPWDILRINEILIGEISESRIDGEVSKDAHIDGLLVLGKGSVIYSGVCIEGTLVAGKDCRIGPNCYIRGLTSIGDNCHIGHAVEIKNSLVMQGSSIGHLSYCGDSIIGEKVNFGAGTITANFRHDGLSHKSMVNGKLADTGRRKFGAVMGDNVHTGIHTSIYPGRKLWPDTMTLPGSIVSEDLM